MDNQLNDSWNEYRKLILDALDRLKDSLEDTIIQLHKLETSTVQNKADIEKLLNEEIERLTEKLQTLINKNKDVAQDISHKLDIRLNTLETKLYTYTAIIGTIISTLISFGKSILESWLK